MIICSCNGITDHDVREAAADGTGVRTVSDVYRTLGGCDGQCHRCARSIRKVLEGIGVHRRGCNCGACDSPCHGDDDAPSHLSIAAE